MALEDGNEFWQLSGIILEHGAWKVVMWKNIELSYLPNGYGIWPYFKTESYAKVSATGGTSLNSGAVQSV